LEAIEALTEEHRMVERIAYSLEVGARRLEAREALSPGFFLEAADLARGFIDLCHHRKEETVLFPALQAAGVSDRGGLINELLQEHEQGRLLVHEVRAAAEKFRGGDVGSAGLIWYNARKYVDLLREHMNKEEVLLFPLVERVIHGERRIQLAKDFDRVEEEETGEGQHERYLAAAGALEREVRV
jgi:hemerythrin-like domain-containing protein